MIKLITHLKNKSIKYTTNSDYEICDIFAFFSFLHLTFYILQINFQFETLLDFFFFINTELTLSKTGISWRFLNIAYFYYCFMF